MVIYIYYAILAPHPEFHLGPLRLIILRPPPWARPARATPPLKGGRRHQGVSPFIYIYTPVISYIVLYTYDCIRIYTHIVH